MNCFFVIFASVLSAAHSSNSLSKGILQYFRSDNVQNIRTLWDDHRKSIEHALASAMQETIGKDGLNVFTMKPSNLRLTDTYYHKHDPVVILYKDLDLVQLPHCWLPDAVFSIASNVLKVETTLTKMIVNAEYMLIRNSSDLIDNKSEQNPYINSPFLFTQVQNSGQITILIDGCLLSGYIIAKLKSRSIDLGHEKFMLTNCEYSVEIYNKDSGIPPVVIAYSDKKPANSLEIKHYLLRLLKDEFITKLQATIYSYINTSAIFGKNLPAYEEQQNILFYKTSSNLTKLIRDQNQDMLNQNSGAVNIPDYYTTWDNSGQCLKYYNNAGMIKLSKMVLTGLGTAYYSNTGGPFKLDSVMIGEQIRFNTLQVRGEINLNVNKTMPTEDSVEFSIEISDFAVNIEIDVRDDGMIQPKCEVAGYRKIELATDENIAIVDRTLITGYLVDEVSKAIIDTITSVSKAPVLLSNQVAEKIDNVGNVDDIAEEEPGNSNTADSSRVLVEAALEGKLQVMPKNNANNRRHRRVLSNKVPKD